MPSKGSRFPRAENGPGATIRCTLMPAMVGNTGCFKATLESAPNSAQIWIMLVATNRDQFGHWIVSPQKARMKTK